MPRFSLEKIVAAKLSGDVARLSTMTLGRVHQHHLTSHSRSFALLTAWQEGEAESINIRNTERLHHQLRSTQIGFARLLAHRRGIESRMAMELWVWPNGIGLEHTVKLACQYKQNSIMYSGTGTSGEIQLLSLGAQTGAVTVVERFSVFDPVVIAASYAARGVFFGYVPFGWFEGLAWRHGP